MSSVDLICMGFDPLPFWLQGGGSSFPSRGGIIHTEIRSANNRQLQLQRTQLIAFYTFAVVWLHVDGRLSNTFSPVLLA